ncbi:hypothetical protein TNCV_2399181 [Trichonephila clavipes]|uniref:Uncharacterized protein n=1 Tax=Trichonephila clavipes TaxID=2585209 RepID=A0A8X6VRW8_TRICX|nr:hypothetical protein TNCV_2399181 [Trichonephila clavipes]
MISMLPQPHGTRVNCWLTDHSSPELMLARKEFTSILSEVFKPSPHSSLSRVSGWQWSASLCSSYIRFVGGGVLPVSKVAGQ